MGIFRALGLGMLIVMLKFLIPEVFSALEKTLIALFDTLQTAVEAGAHIRPLP